MPTFNAYFQITMLQNLKPTARKNLGSPQIHTVKNILLMNEWVNQAIKEWIKKIHGSQWKWKQDSPNPWDAAKAVLRGKYIAIQVYLNKQERSQIHNLTLQLEELEKEQQRKPKSRRRREIIKIREEINDKQTKNSRTDQWN